jgi:hypothetical protein
MSSLTWLVAIFFILLLLSITVYVLVVRAFYWGDKKEAPPARKGQNKD